MRYQIMILGPRAGVRLTAFRDELRSRVGDLGLNFKKDFQLLTVGQMADIDWNGTPAGVWFGDSKRATNSDLHALRTLLAEDCIVFPVVDTLLDYAQLVPPELRSVNGVEWDVPRLVADVLRVFGLTRAQRQAFISYKRNESRSVAVQLFDALSHRGYRVFLDTFSIRSAEPFQEALWGEIADVDLLVFLDTKTALTSEWVYQELARANDLGLGVLQLIWPGRKRTPGTEFSDLLRLKKGSFQNGTGDAPGRLKDSTLKRILTAAERARIRSLKSRRDRVVSDLIDQARAQNLDAVVHPAGNIELRRALQKVATVIPLVGVPDAATIEQQERKKKRGELRTSRVVYDSLGVRPAWLDHLAWLNCRHRLNTSQLTDLDDWLGGL